MENRRLTGSFVPLAFTCLHQSAYADGGREIPRVLFLEYAIFLAPTTQGDRFRTK
jgi:hypothetical protein